MYVWKPHSVAADADIFREKKQEAYVLVSFAAVIRVVTQRFSPTNAVSGGEALHDDPNNGCEGDYICSG